MMKILLLIVAFAFTSGLTAQEWFPVGASWYYNQIILLEGETYSYFEVTDEIIINGKTVKIISGSCNCGVPGIGGYLYQEGDKIYSYNPESSDSLKILYDFTLIAGDTLIIKSDSESWGDGIFLIDSVTFFQTGTETLRVQHITHLAFDIGWGNQIIERIGSNGCLYPQVSFCDPSTGGLRCYEDDVIGLINFQDPPRSCAYVSTAVHDPLSAPELNLYPNPATNNVHIQSEDPVDHVTIFNNLGLPVYKISPVKDAEFDLDVHFIPPGIYHLQVVFSDHRIGHGVILIQK